MINYTYSGCKTTLITGSEIITLHDAIKADDIEKITKFIKEGADINEKEKKHNPAGFNTVQLACFHNSLEVKLACIIFFDSKFNQCNYFENEHIFKHLHFNS